MKKITLTLGLISLLCLQTFAQGGWQRIYPMMSGGPNGDGIDAVRQTPDGGYILAGVTENVSAACKNLVVKVNDLGNIQWSYTYFGTVNNQSWASNVELAPQGGYYVEGRNRNPLTYLDEIFIQHLDDNGNQLWVSSFPQANVPTKGAVTADGGYVAIAYDYDNVTSVDSVVLIKVDATGNLNWLTKYPASDVGIVHSVIQTQSGEYVVEGYHNQKSALCKFDANGGFLWRQLYGVQTAHPEYIGKVVENADGSFTVAGNNALTFGAHDVYVYKTDANGVLIWEQQYGQSTAMATDMSITADGGYIITGVKNYNNFPRVILIKTDSNGNQQWAKEYNGNGTGTHKAYSVRQTMDGGYIVGGAKVTSFYERENMYLIKTDELGEIYSNTLQGYVFDDFNTNCQTDAAEYRMENRIIEVQGNQSYWTSTDSDGHYWLRVDTGNYLMILHPSPNAPYWQTSPCSNDTLQLSIPNQYTSIDTSFAMEAIAYCPLLTVNLATPFLRRCFDSNYYVHYCNNGTMAANNAYIDVAFDSYLEVDTLNLPFAWSSLGNNSYRFDIGTVGIGECGSIPVTVYVSCNALLGQTHCSEATIFPVSNCLLPAWTGAVINVNAACVNDSVIFTITNSGAIGSSPLNYNILQDTVMVSTGSFTLVAGQSTTLIFPTPNGSTFILNAQQEPGYPALLGDSLLSVSIEGCGGNLNAGVVTQFSQYDGSPFLDIDCRMNIGAYDPNDKSPFPVGYGANHYITPATVLDYQIRFQNTGTDTAFTVIIRDTISNFLDITTLQAGSSSHPYTYFVHGDNIQVVDFVFQNIQLPDSNVNEPASHGFIQFSIHQKNANPLGTLIENTAGIYFDFNEPVITNTTMHQIEENFVDMNLVGLSKKSFEMNGCRVYPNPANDFTTIELLGDPKGPFQLELISALGNTIQKSSHTDPKIILNRGQIPSGIYAYRILGQDGLVATGKIRFQ
jgi:hypothetical protein